MLKDYARSLISGWVLQKVVSGSFERDKKNRHKQIENLQQNSIS